MTDCVLYAFLNCSFKYDELWYGDRLDLGEEYGLYFITKKVNNRSNPEKFSNRDSKIIIINIYK